MSKAGTLQQAEAPSLSRAEELEVLEILNLDEGLAQGEKNQTEDIAERNQKIQENMGLVVFIAKQYGHRSRHLTLRDLTHEGVLGLIRAIKKFNPEKGFEFSTYAIWWIRAYIKSALVAETNFLTAPKHVSDQSDQYKRARELLRAEPRFEPSDEELCEQMGLPIGKISEIRDKHRRICLCRRVRSLDAPLTKTLPDISLGDHTKDEKALPPGEIADASLRKDAFKRALSKLLNVDRDIVSMRFGLGKYKGVTYFQEEIGRKHNLTKQRVQQRIEKSLKYLKKDLRLSKFAR